MMIGIGAVGGFRRLFTKCIGADIEASILEEAGGLEESILEGIKSDRVGRTSGFKKTREKASAITSINVLNGTHEMIDRILPSSLSSQQFGLLGECQ